MHDLKNPDNGIPDGWPEEVTISVSAEGNKGTTERYVRATLSAEAFIQLLTEHRVGHKDELGWAPYDFEKDHRTSLNSIGADVAVLDIDDGTSLDDIETALEDAGIAAVVASTFSHLSEETLFAKGKYAAWRKANPKAADEGFMRDHRKGYADAVWRGSKVMLGDDGKPIIKKVKRRDKIVEDITVRHAPCEKYRIVVPLARPFLSKDHADPDAAWETIVLGLAGRLKLKTDPNTLDRGRLFFGPRHPAGVRSAYRIVPGKPFDAERALARAAIREDSRAGDRARHGAPLARQSGSAVKLFRGNIEALCSAVMAVPHDDNIDMWDWLAMIFAICEETDGSEDGNELAHEWSKTWIGGYDYDETERVWRRAVRNLEKDMKKAAGGTIRQFIKWYAPDWKMPIGFEWGDGPKIVFEDER
ncbi:PriCT-2 domain-containing protein, partial [Methylosinus sp. R-45379]|uniref:PriCT-2 domain-containing protein n=1 Tax=Methylosinus sp. R-45379 TaxID=980563 RepID=UPI000A8172FE